LTVPPFLRCTATGVTIEVSVQPRARRAALELREGSLRVAVTQPADEGRANAAVISLLSQTWRIPKSTLAVVHGATARRKVLSARGDPDLLVGRIVEWMRAHG
jgi:uncharacterized protein (TIGR00251 family)